MTTCPNGVYCTLGFKCRYLGGHVASDPSTSTNDLGLKLLREPVPDQDQERNRIDPAVLRLMRSKKVHSDLFRPENNLF